MASCAECGSTLDSGAAYCPSCGRRVGGREAGVLWDEPPPGERSGLPHELPGDVRNWAIAAHLSAFVAAWAALAFLGPLVVWLTQRDKHPFVAAHAREALNFNLSVLLYAFAGFMGSLLLIGIPFLGAAAVVLFGVPLAAGLGLFWLITTVLAAVRASNGEDYRYPLAIGFVR